MKIQILRSAFDDLDRGRTFYDCQGEGLGSYFLDTLFSEIDSLLLYGGVHSQLFGYHRLLAKRFPYAIYYKMEDDGNLVIWRVLDLRQSPRRIAHALTGRRTRRSS